MSTSKPSSKTVRYGLPLLLTSENSSFVRRFDFLAPLQKTRDQILDRIESLEVIGRQRQANVRLNENVHADHGQTVDIEVGCERSLVSNGFGPRHFLDQSNDFRGDF